MDGDIFVMLLDDLKRGWKAGRLLRRCMKRRADRWNGEAYPFDRKWRGLDRQEDLRVDELLRLQGQAVSLARSSAATCQQCRIGATATPDDRGLFLRRCACGTTERQIHHYDQASTRFRHWQYREHPDDYYLLRIDSGSMGSAL
jgi:hypothetical protein